jgi:hypothetical protein
MMPITKNPYTVSTSQFDTESNCGDRRDITRYSSSLYCGEATAQVMTRTQTTYETQMSIDDIIRVPWTVTIRGRSLSHVFYTIFWPQDLEDELVVDIVLANF